jgi:hypothetical protein
MISGKGSGFVAGVWLLAACVPAPCQANMTVQRAQYARSLSGVVVIQGNGTPISDVAVAECSTGFTNCVTTTRTDRDGRFFVRSNRPSNVHYLRFLTRGLCEEREVITLRRGSNRLMVDMVMGS